MGAEAVVWEERAGAGAAVAPLRGELRYGAELAQLLASREFHAVERRADAPPVMLIPGFMAGDRSLNIMRGWLRRRGHRVRTSGIRTNVGCAEQVVRRLETRVRAFADEAGEDPWREIGELVRYVATALKLPVPERFADAEQIAVEIAEGAALRENPSRLRGVVSGQGGHLANDHQLQLGGHFRVLGMH